MRHRVVTRTVLGLSGLLLGASVAFAWLVGRGSEAQAAGGAELERGERALALRCAACHELAELGASLAAAPDLDAAAAELGAFLETHGSASAEEDRAIVAALRRRAEGAAQTPATER